MKTLNYFLTGLIAILFSFQSNAQNVITVSGNYPGNQVWDADTVKITGNTIITGRLMIEPGTLVEFQGNYSIEANGIKALGQDGNEITFTIHDTLGFSNLSINAGGWGGITDWGTNTGDSSMFLYCRFEYGKKIIDPIPYFKGLLKFGDNVNNVRIDHCVFEHNYSKDGAVIKSDRKTVVNHCRITGNYCTGLSLRKGDANNCTIRNNMGNGIELWNIECNIAEDTITGNTGYGVYIYQCKKASIKNNVISGNTLGVFLFQVKTAEFCGTISDRTIWDADTLKITSDLTFGRELVIRPGTYVEFQGHYELAADSIYAVGCVSDSITFTVHDTIGFSNRNIANGGWKKISATSFAEFNYCRFMFGKNIDNSGDHFYKKKGLLIGETLNIKNTLLFNNYSAAILFENTSPIISNCILKNNTFDRFTFDYYHFRSEISYCYFIGNSGIIENTDIKETDFKNNINLKFLAGEDEHLYIEDCIFQNNKDLVFGPGGASYPYFKFINTKIIDNEHLSMRFADAGIMYFIGNIICNNTFNSSFHFYMCLENNIISNNTFYKNKILDGSALISFEICSFNFYNNILSANAIGNSKGLQITFRDYVNGNFRNNLIEGGLDAIENNGIGIGYVNNIDAKPAFLNPMKGDFSLASNSPGINLGDSLLLLNFDITYHDLLGNPRIVGENIDIGACEYQGAPTNTKPSLNNMETLMLSKNETGLVIIRFYDPDTLDTHTIKLSTQSGSLAITPELKDTSGRTFAIVPDQDWEGRGQVEVQITDSHGNTDIDSFKVIVFDGLCGSISKDTVLGPGIIHVKCDLSIEDSVFVKISPGTTFLFEDNFAITIAGKIKAEGTRNNPIVFTTADTSGYSQNAHLGWGGIFKQGNNNDTLTFKYCQFKYARLLYWNPNFDRDYGLITQTGNLYISNCVFKYNNSTEHGLTKWFSEAIIDSSSFSFNQAPYHLVYARKVSNSEFRNNTAYDILNTGYAFNNKVLNNNGYGIIAKYDVINNLIANNSSVGLYIYDHSKIINNTIVSNGKNEGGGIYISGNAQLYNNIIYGNGASIARNNIYFNYEYDTYMYNCLLEGGKQGVNIPQLIKIYENCIDADPRFVQTDLYDYHLAASSPCINTGISDTTGLHLPATDLDGNPRISGQRIDIGAYEFQDEPECPNIMLAQGVYEHSVTWCADTVKVTGDVTVNGKLTILPGTYIEFQGYYKIEADELLANGTVDDSVIFTIHDTTGFSNPDTTLGGWAGLSTSHGLTMHYCRIEYIKSVDEKPYYAISGSQDVNHSVISNNNLSDKHYILNGGFIRNSRIIHNKGTAIGGHGATIDSCVISYNSYGVDLDDQACLKIENSVVEHNNYCGIVSVDLNRSVINNNIIQYNGTGFGGSTCWDSVYFLNNIVRHNSVGIHISWESEILISGNRICSNNVGISLDGSSNYIVNNLLYNNMAAILLIRGSFPVLMNNVIVNNVAQNGSAIYYCEAMGGSSWGKVPIYNCIIWNNKNDEGKQLYACRQQGPSICNPIAFPGNIYFSNVEDIGEEDITGDYINNMDEDPQFVDSANFDFHLKANSPCINTGIPDTAGLHLPTTDLDDNPRVADLQIDMGAYEYSASLFEILQQPERIYICAGEKGELIANASGGVTGYQWQQNGTDIPEATSRILSFDTLSKKNKGKYNCLISANGGSYSTDTVTVMPLTVPEITAQTQSFGICEKEDTVLNLQVSDPDSLSYAWYFQDERLEGFDGESLSLDDINSTDEGDYYGITSNLCGSDTSSIINISVYPLPFIYLGEDTTVHIDDVLTLDAGEGFENYLWNTGDNTQVLPVYASQPGPYEYRILVTDSNGCAGGDTIIVTIKLPDILPGYTHAVGFKVYPNPTTGVVYLVPQADINSEISVTVVDADGRMLHKGKIMNLKSGQDFSIDLSELENGIYLLMIDQYPVRFIKNSE